jgi:anti-sigma factor RsiW
MNCRRARELIQEKLEGELNAELQHALKSHLIKCHNCRAYEAGIEQLDSLLSRQPVVKPPEGFAARVASAAGRKRRALVTVERRNLRVAAACVAAVLVIAAIMPMLVALPSTEELTDNLVAMAPALPDSSYLPSSLSDLAPQLPESGLTLADAADHLKYSLDSLGSVEIPSLGLTNTLILILAALAGAAIAFQAVYFIMPHRRRR